jgi:hypothetical protein
MAKQDERRAQIGSRLVQAGFVIVLVVLWYLATNRWGVSHLLLPNPVQVWRELVDILKSGEYLGDLRVTLTELATAFAISTTSGVTIAKPELKAGGHDKDKGDADAFDEHQLAFTVKLTPSAAGNYTINGTFKFAVCDKAGSTCLAKKEPIAIQIAAK